MDKYGNYYCVDRLKELIKYSKSILLYIWLLAAQQRTNTSFPQRVSKSPQPSSRAW